MTPRRYQLRKDALAIVERGHPWIFRDQLSSAAQVFADGQWLRLVAGDNRVVGYGIYEAEGAIAIRILRAAPERPGAAWLRAQLRAAVARRATLAAQTDAIRLVHGESDGIPAVVVDRFADTLVIASYSIGSDALARYVARALAIPDPELASIAGPARHVVLRPAHRRRGQPQITRTLRGTPPDVVGITEDALSYAVDLAEGHKTGTYLDLRGLRRAIAASPLSGARVLNLFSYTGMLGRAAEVAGAAEIVHVDVSQRALAFAAEHHTIDRARHRFIPADVFDWLPAQDGADTFDLVIVDPPAMTSRKTQLPAVLAAYRKLYRAAARVVRPGGAIVAACCTSRVERSVFVGVVREVLGPRFSLARDLAPELDHPVGFTQADYLKIGIWRAAIDVQ